MDDFIEILLIIKKVTLTKAFNICFSCLYALYVSKHGINQIT